MQINKSDRNDAAGTARIMQTGWFKEVRVKDLDSHSVRGCWRVGRCLSRSSVIPRTKFAACFKNVGLVIGRAKFNVFAVRAEELIEDRPEMITVVGPLLKACRPAISSARNPAAGTKARKFGRTCGRIKPGDPLR